MAQINLHVDDDFSAVLADFMRVSGVKTKSAAIRLAVRQSLRAMVGESPRPAVEGWVGLAVDGSNPSPRFASHDALWADEPS